MAQATNKTNLFSFYLGALRELGRALSIDAQRAGAARPLRESLFRLLGTFAIGRGALLLWDAERRTLACAATKGFRMSAEALPFALPKKTLRQLARGAAPFHPHMPPGGLAAAAAVLMPICTNVGAQWIVPLGSGTQFIGFALLGPRVSGQPLATIELEVLEEMASVIALRIEDAHTRRKMSAQVRQLQRQGRQLKQIYMETVRALAGVIDGPEQDNAPGHSARVAALSSEMGRRLKLGAGACERLYLAGLLHDIGKQIISREVLEKRDPLINAERRAIEEHPAAGCELLSHLSFPWGDVAEIIRHHHERLDGTGYPDRLRGDQISIEAKILMMAEAFDSMTSDQPWRPRLAFPKICEQISRNLGIQFEPKVVQALADAVEAGLDASQRAAGDGAAATGAAQADFIPHLSAAFDPALIKTMLSELRRQIDRPRKPAVIIEAIGTRESSSS